jgi:sugar/nucleoside kinase (ribokinase family)
MSVLVLGTVALDNVKTPSGERKKMLGGSAAHFSMSARLFTRVHLSAVVGADFPRKHIDFLKGKGVILDSLVESEGKTFEWTGEYKGDLNSAITLHTELGVLATFRPYVSPKEKNISHVFLANVDPDIQRHLLGSMRNPVLVGLDSMNYWIHTKRKALLRAIKGATIYVANDQEARDLSGETNLIKAARRLHSLGPRMILIKKGEHGVLFFDGKDTLALPAYPIDKVVDPTGAGDTFAGGFFGYLSRVKKINDANIKKALALGTMAASFNVEGFGVEKTSRLTRVDLFKRLGDFRRRVIF